MALETKAEALTRLQAELAVIENSIKNIEQNGQSFSKGDTASGFKVDQVQLPTLYARKDAVRNKINTWELY